MSFHGLSTGWSVAKKLCFVFVPQTAHMSRRKKNRRAEEQKILQSLKTTSGSSWGPKLVRMWSMNCDRTTSQFIKHRGPMITHVRFLSIPRTPNSAVYQVFRENVAKNLPLESLRPIGIYIYIYVCLYIYVYIYICMSIRRLLPID